MKTYHEFMIQLGGNYQSALMGPLSLCEEQEVVQTHRWATPACWQKLFFFVSLWSDDYGFCLTGQLSNAFHVLFKTPACFLWHLQMNAIGQFVFQKDYVVRGTTDALMRPYLLPSNRSPQLSCSSVCQPPWCLFMVFIGSLYCAQWRLNLYN